MTTTKKTPEQKKRAALEALVWKHTHRDFKSKYEDGTKTVLAFVEGKGTCALVLAKMTDAELLAKLPSSVRATVSS